MKKIVKGVKKKRRDLETDGLKDGKRFGEGG